MKLENLNSIPSDFPLEFGKPLRKCEEPSPEWVSAGKPGLEKNSDGRFRFVPDDAHPLYKAHNFV